MIPRIGLFHWVYEKRNRILIYNINFRSRRSLTSQESLEIQKKYNKFILFRNLFHYPIKKSSQKVNHFMWRYIYIELLFLEPLTSNFIYLYIPCICIRDNFNVEMFYSGWYNGLKCSSSFSNLEEFQRVFSSKILIVVDQLHPTLHDGVTLQAISHFHLNNTFTFYFQSLSSSLSTILRLDFFLRASSSRFCFNSASSSSSSSLCKSSLARCNFSSFSLSTLSSLSSPYSSWNDLLRASKIYNPSSIVTRVENILHRFLILRNIPTGWFILFYILEPEVDCFSPKE